MINVSLQDIYYIVGIISAIFSIFGVTYRICFENKKNAKKITAPSPEN